MRIVEFITASVVLTLMPGPDILFVLTQSLTRGAKSGICVALGLCSGLLVHTMIVAFGVAIVITNSPFLFNLIKYMGAAYLCYMGILSVREMMKTGKKEYLTVQETENSRTTGVSYGSLYRTGVIMNVLNPKVIIFFLSFLPQFLSVDSTTPKADVFLLCGLFAAQALLVFTIVAFISGGIAAKLSLNRISNRQLAGVRAIVYFAIAGLFAFGL